MKYTQHDRFARYMVLAAIPAGASAGYATADIIHYGGPAIEIGRSIVSSSTSTSGNFIFSHGSASILYGGTSGPMMGQNIGQHISISSESGLNGHFDAQAAKIKMNRDAGSSWAIATMGYGLAKRFNQSSVIGGSISKLNPSIAKLAMTVSTSFVDSQSSQSSFAQIGEWAVEEGEESRGYLGFAHFDEETGSIGFGWMDIGWDGELITIHDWAFNTNGSIHVGQTTAVPGGTGLAALAMGAAGMRRRRKRVA
jgi:MYXO-CTERM domain-containing protein